MGGNWYSRAKTGMFEVPNPLSTLGRGVDALPEAIRFSTVLTGNDLGMLANVEQLPSGDASADIKMHKKAQALLGQGDLTAAWHTLMK
jgi:hypothetical protein